MVDKSSMSEHEIQEFTPDFERVLNKDKYGLQKLWHEVQTRSAEQKPVDRLFDKLKSGYEVSSTAVALKKQLLPNIEFPEQLPISERREEIAEAISKHQVVILAGETGSGKTTQLPKICLALGRGINGVIGHTQPRRLAASTVANRIAEELNVELGQGVGYQVRFNDNSTDQTYIKLMTDGILLAEIQNDRYLNRYDTLIIDEAHERSLNIDFLLGYIKSILPKRPDLKVIITSATIDLERFSKHFNDAPIIEVSGRTYPVDVRYRPMIDDEDDQYQAIVSAVEELLHEEKSQGSSSRGGDFLVFLSGEREIREAALALRKADIPHLEVLPLYARLSLTEQTRVFSNHRGRRIVLATNVAETSVTVPGIRYVIDPGYARISRYSYRTKIQRLPIEAISQASANQRKGRCGRVSAGICVRLYEESDFLARQEFTDPEILRTNLASVILQMLQLRLGDIRHFPFIDSPDRRLINDGYNLLRELKAVDDKNRVTDLGRKIASLPIDPRLGAVVLEADKHQALKEVLVIVSALAVQDPRERPADKQQASDEKHRRFWHEESDFLAYLSLWDYVEQQRQELSQNQLRKLLKKEFISYLRMREWRDIHHQLRVACKPLKLTENAAEAGYDVIHQSLLVGLLDYVGQKTENNDYLGTRNRKFSIFPGSSQFKKRPQWLCAGELLETAKLYAHNVAKVDPLWIYKAGEHLVKRNYFEPHYNPSRGQVMAYERVTLMGLTLIEKQRINYSSINAKEAREVFIRSALVEGRYLEAKVSRNKKNTSSGPGEFYRYNTALIKDVIDLEAKSRRKDILVDDQVIFDFYDQRIGDESVNLAAFEHWRKKAELENPKILYLSREQLMLHAADDITEVQFPSSVTWNGVEYKVSYHFDPTSADDGVSVHIPVALLHQIPEFSCQWLVPGILKEKCTALIKGLPKQWRKNFVPVPSFADRAALNLIPGNTPFTDALSEQLFRLTQVRVPKDAWESIQLDHYYQMNFKVVDDRGKLIEQSRDLEHLKEKYRENVQKTLQTAGQSVEQTGLTQWTFGDLPQTKKLKRSGVNISAFPALVDDGDSVSLKMHDNPVEADLLSLRGSVRLVMLKEHQMVKYLKKELLKGRDIGIVVTSLKSREAVTDDIIAAAIREIIFPDGVLRSQEAFEESIEQHRHGIIPRAIEIEKIFFDLLGQMVSIKNALKSNKNALALTWAANDIKNQLDALIYPQFLYETKFEQFQQFPRYLKAIEVRIEKVVLNVQKDKSFIAEIDEHWQRYKDLLAKKGSIWCKGNERVESYRWQIEELRVSLFAQTLKTPQPISSKRLDKLWQEIVTNL